VHRPPTPNSGFVISLLRHLAATDFDGVPRYLGKDDSGREILSYLPGTVPSELGHHGDAVLQQAARLIRRYHDATTVLFHSEAALAAGIEVACHNDLSPCNAVFRDGAPVALIDFDAAAPGSRAFDLGYATWLWLDIGNAAYSAAEQWRRLLLFLDAYGPYPEIDSVVEAMMLRQGILIAEAIRIGDTAMRDWAAHCRDWTQHNLAPRVASAPQV
jgi:aminoglycoside phosphotransferase (APT) family kinase protein